MGFAMGVAATAGVLEWRHRRGHCQRALCTTGRYRANRLPHDAWPGSGVAHVSTAGGHPLRLRCLRLARLYRLPEFAGQRYSASDRGTASAPRRRSRAITFAENDRRQDRPHSSRVAMRASISREGPTVLVGASVMMQAACWGGISQAKGADSRRLRCRRCRRLQHAACRHRLCDRGNGAYLSGTH